MADLRPTHRLFWRGGGSVSFPLRHNCQCSLSKTKLITNYITSQFNIKPSLDYLELASGLRLPPWPQPSARSPLPFNPIHTHRFSPPGLCSLCPLWNVLYRITSVTVFLNFFNFFYLRLQLRVYSLMKPPSSLPRLIYGHLLPVLYKAYTCFCLSVCFIQFYWVMIHIPYSSPV